MTSTMRLLACVTIAVAAGPLVAGERNGAWTFSRTDGARLATGAFAAGQLTGEWLVYADDGTTTAQRLTFRADKLVAVDGERASRTYQRGFSAAVFAVQPAVLVEVPDAETRPLRPRSRAVPRGTRWVPKRDALHPP